MFTSVPLKIIMQSSGIGSCFRTTVYLHVLAACSESRITLLLASALFQVPPIDQMLGIQGRLRGWGWEGY